MPQPINISASRGASILGLSKWKTPVQIWLEIMEARESGFCEKNKYQMPIFEETAQLRWGKAFESAIIELAEKKANNMIHKREELFQQEYITCHIDGMYQSFDRPSQPISKSLLHEGKTTSFFYFNDNFGEPGTDKVPIEYQVQCQHQMICTGAEKVILSVLVFPKRVEEWEEMGWEIYQDRNEKYYIRIPETNKINNPMFWATVLEEQGYFYQYSIEAHPELQKNMIKAYTEFWNNHVLTGKEPEPQTYDDIKALCTEPVGTILADDEIERLMAQYKDIKSEIGGAGDLSVQAENIKIQILNYMRKSGFTEDDESKDKWILRSQDGKKLATYGKNKKGYFVFR